MAVLIINKDMKNFTKLPGNNAKQAAKMRVQRLFPKQMSTYGKGFTLLELLATMAIAGILFGIAIPSFNTAIRNNRLTTMANDFVTALNVARSESVKRGQRVTVRRTGANWEDGWQVFVDVVRGTVATTGIFNDNGNATLCEATEDCVLKVYPALTENYTLRSTILPDSITFAPSGQLEGGVGGSFGICDNRDGNGLPEANTSRLIIVNLLGRVGMANDGNKDGIPNTNPADTTAATNIATCIP